jgi:pimeloyl-ACP methyl ester carboxylesterase
MVVAQRRRARRLLAALAWLFLQGCSGNSPRDLGAEPEGEAACAAALLPLVEGDARADVVMESEAGFVEVPAHEGCSPHPSRVFYSFRPSDDTPATKPLLVLFNGGPGFPTTLGLLPYGTGPRTLRIPEGRSPADAVWDDNPHRFTRFANLLYIDEPLSGLSYGLGTRPDTACAVDRQDAADFVRVVLTFLERHRALQEAPVVLVGESYGAYRALNMLDLLLHRAGVADEERALAELVEQHLERAFPQHRGAFGPEHVARQFGWLVSVQGALLDPAYFACPAPPAAMDPFDTSRPAGWTLALDERAMELLRDETGTHNAFGVPLASIPGLAPEERGEAFRLPVEEKFRHVEPLTKALDASLQEELGSLEPDDAYFRVYPAREFAWGVENPNDEPLLRVQPFVRILATNALRDGQVCVDTFLDRIVLTETRCPSLTVHTYEEAGHQVTVTGSAEFAANLEAWLMAR